MGLDREEAWTHLCSWTETDSLRQHARAVELVMRAARHRYGGPSENEEIWGIAGMLHDADYEKWPEDHPERTVAWLRARGEAEIAYAVSAHYKEILAGVELLGVEPEVHIQFVIDALKPHARELGLEGRVSEG